MNLKSKLPHTGLSIFTVMSQLAQQHDAINLAQGFPDFEVSLELINKVESYMKKGYNQYAPMLGQPILRKTIAQKIKHTYQVEVKPEEVTVTAGATQALYTCITAIVHNGDEVIYFDPAYESYRPAIELNGGTPIPINLRKEDFSIPWDELMASITSNTKMIILNTPHNPSGAILGTDDLDQLAALIRGKNIYILSDEVYEHLVYDGKYHVSILMHTELRKKSIAVYSFGKTFHATGWKIGYTIAPTVLTKEIQKIHQFVVFSVSSAIQMALTDHLASPDNYEYLPSFFQKKRDFLLSAMAASKFTAIPCAGTYFQLFSYDGLSDLNERNMAEWLTKTHGVATIPLSPFYSDESDYKYLRICFAKSEKTLQQAANKLCQI